MKKRTFGVRMAVFSGDGGCGSSGGGSGGDGGEKKVVVVGLRITHLVSSQDKNGNV